MTNRTAAVLRWASLPFAVVAGSIAGAFLAGLFISLGMSRGPDASDDGMVNFYIRPFLQFCVTGWLWVAIAMRVAPSGKSTAAITAISVLYILILAGSIGFWMKNSAHPAACLNLTVGAIGAGLAALLAFTEARRKGELG